MDRYAGPGFVGTAAAIKRIAQVQHPERWSSEAIPEPEAKIWNAIGISLAPEYFEDHLIARVPEPRDAAFVDRICDYREAISALRDALLSGNAHAGFRDDTGEIRAIEPTIWGSENGQTALLKGTALIDAVGQAEWRFLILRENEVEAIGTAPNQMHAKSPSCELTAPARRGRVPTIDKTQIQSAVFELMDHHGAISADDPEWNTQAHLERAVRKKLGTELSESRLRELIKPSLLEWEAKKGR